MKGGHYRRLPLVLAALALAAVTGIEARPAQAQGAQTVGIRILDAPTSRSDDPRAHQYIVDHLPPGTTIKRRVEVSNDTDKAQPVQLYAAAADIKDGAVRFGDGRAANELTTWTTVEPPSLSVPAGAKSVATVTIAVPAGASPGERYGVVWAELAPAAAPPGGGIGAVNRVGVRIYLSVGPGGEPASDFSITALEARRDADGNPVVAATVHNIGGRALDLSGQLKLADGPGGLAAGPFEAKLGTTLGIGQTEPVLVILDRAVPAGPWGAHITLRSGVTEREATAKITFPVAAASASGPVATRARASSGTPWLPIVGGVVVLVGLLALVTRLVRHRRHDGRTPAPGPPG